MALKIQVLMFSVASERGCERKLKEVSTVTPTEELDYTETKLLSERKNRVRFLVGNVYDEIKDGKILDVAMGRWSLIKALFPTLFVVGVDRNFPDSPPDKFYRVNLKNNLPFEDEDFSMAFAGEIIEHVGERAAHNLLTELYRVLRPNGFLILTTPNGFRSKLKDALGRAGLEEHEREFSYREMKRMLINAGFRIVSSGGINPFFVPWSATTKFFSLRIHGSLSTQSIFLCKKEQ